MPPFRDYPRHLYRKKDDGSVEWCRIEDAEAENSLKPEGWVRHQSGISERQTVSDSAEVLTKRSRKLPGSRVH